MNEANQNKFNAFIGSFKQALLRSRDQTDKIVAEITSDFEAHVQRFQTEGLPEEKAVDLAIQEMGNPYELAHHLQREVPPFGGRTWTVIRYLAAAALIIWALVLCWTFRAWTYGFSAISIGSIIGIHLPFILLLWPRIVWKKNWLFGLFPATIAVAVTLFFAIAGVENSSETLGVATQPPKTALNLFVLALGIFSLVLLFAMQQRSQQRMAILLVLVTAGLVEGVFQIEEFVFRQDRDRISTYFEDHFERTNAYPSREDFKDKGPKLSSSYNMLDPSGKDFTIFWNRPLDSGFAIVYSSENGNIHIQD